MNINDIQDVNLKLSASVPTNFYVKQFDNKTRILKISIKDFKHEDYAQVSSITINYVRDNVIFYRQDLEVPSKNDYIECVIPNNITHKAGRVVSELIIKGKNEERISAGTITFKVLPSPAEEAIETNEVWSGLDKAIYLSQHAEEFIKNEETRLASETERVKAEAQRMGAESKREIAETERDSSETDRKLAEKDRKESESTRVVNETARIEAETDRTTKETARIESEKTRQQNEEARVENEQARVENETARIEAEQTRQDFYEGFHDGITDLQDRTEKFEGLVKDGSIDYFGKEHRTIKQAIDSNMDYVNNRLNDAYLLPYEGTNITANNSYDGRVKNLSIKGQTYQNLWTVNNSYEPITRIATGKWVSSYSASKNLFKPSTLYTVICKVYTNTLNGQFSICEAYSTSGVFPDTWKIYAGQTGTFVRTMTTRAEFTDDVGLRSFINADSEEGSITFQCIILEGDLTNKELPSSITGIESVAEKEVNTDGKYPINVKSCEENGEESTQTILLNEPLRSLPNGVCDEIVGGKLIRRVGKYTVNESNISNITAYSIGVEGKVRWLIANDANLIKNTDSPSIICTICDKFPSTTTGDTWDGTAEGVAQNNSDNSLFIYSDRYSENTPANKTALCNELLGSTIYYELATPTIVDMPINSVYTYDGITHIMTDNNISPTLHVEVPSNTQAVISQLLTENSALLDDNQELKASADRLIAENEAQKQHIEDLNSVTDYLISQNL